MAPTLQPAALRLLTGEYRTNTGPGTGALNYLLVGLPIRTSSLDSCAGGARISYGPYYLQSGAAIPTYRRGLITMPGNMLLIKALLLCQKGLVF